MLLPWLAAVVGLVASLLFVHRGLAIPMPLIDLRLFRARMFAAANLAHVLVNASSFMIMLLVPFYLARVFANDPLSIGLSPALYPGGAVAASACARWALQHLGAFRLSQLTLMLAAGGLAAISFWPTELDRPLVAAALLVHGFGYGLFQVAVVDVVMATVT